MVSHDNTDRDESVMRRRAQHLAGGRRVSCVFPARNEAASLAETVREWAATLDRWTTAYEIIVVDDGSTDDTATVLHDLSSRYPALRVITHGRNLGYGATIARGFAHATFPLLFFTDADGQYDSRDFPRLLDRIDDADVVVGYRRRRADPRVRDLASRGYNLLTRHLLGVPVRDVNCAFKLIQRDAFRALEIEATGFTVNAELVVRARTAGLRIVEMPVRHRARRAGRSTVRPVHVFVTIAGLARLCWRRRRPARVDAIAGSRTVPAGGAGLSLAEIATSKPPTG